MFVLNNINDFEQIKEDYETVYQKYERQVKAIHNDNYNDICKLAKNEFSYYKDLLFEIIRKFTGLTFSEEKIKDFCEKDLFPLVFNNVTDKVFRRTGLQAEIETRIKEKKATQHNVFLLMKHYSGYIAYYRFYVEKVIRCLLENKKNIIDKQRSKFFIN